MLKRMFYQINTNEIKFMHVLLLLNISCLLPQAFKHYCCFTCPGVIVNYQIIVISLKPAAALLTQITTKMVTMFLRKQSTE